MFSIKTSKLTKKYKDFKAVDSLNLEIKEGEIFGLLGPNGAGKSTTIKMLISLLRTTSGSAHVNGFDVNKDPAKVRRSIGVVFQEPSLDDLLTARENLKMHGLLYGIPSNILPKRMSEVLKLVDLEKKSNDQVKTYSGGMKRRLEIARGLMHIPKVLFLDEPTIGLDPQSRQHIWKYIRQIAKVNKMTIFMTTHYMEEADAICDRIAIIDHGKIVVLDTPQNLKAKLGGDVVKVQSISADLVALKKLSYVKSVKKVDNEIIITVKNANEHLKEILGLCGNVKSVQIKEPSLDDVFMNYTGREMRDNDSQDTDMKYLTK